MEKQSKEKFKGDIINAIFIVSFFIVIIGAFLRYYYLKEYSFTIETSCDPQVEWCYERDCTNPDDCPPNGWSDYKQYNIPAADFDKCQADNCVSYCHDSHQCSEIPCDESEDTCSGVR